MQNMLLKNLAHTVGNLHKIFRYKTLKSLRSDYAVGKERVNDATFAFDSQFYFLCGLLTKNWEREYLCFRCPMRGHDLDVPFPERPQGCWLHRYKLRNFTLIIIISYTSQRWVLTSWKNLSFQDMTLFRWILNTRKATSRQVYSPHQLKPNSWMYNFVEVSVHNLERFQTWGFRIHCLHCKPVSTHFCAGGGL